MYLGLVNLTRLVNIEGKPLIITIFKVMKKPHGCGV